jgi:hypothetical protein
LFLFVFCLFFICFFFTFANVFFPISSQKKDPYGVAVWSEGPGGFCSGGNIVDDSGSNSLSVTGILFHPTHHTTPHHTTPQQTLTVATGVVLALLFGGFTVVVILISVALYLRKKYQRKSFEEGIAFIS